MNAIRSVGLIVLLGCLPILGACNSGQSTSGSIAGAVNDTISNALDKAQEKLRSEPITVSHDVPGQPKAEITPKGDFVVAGKTVAVTPAQRTALLAYRDQVIAIASQGIAIGKQGAALGMRAASTAIAGALSGKPDAEIQQKVEAQTSGIRKAAAELCDRLPALLAEQQKLAAALPAFKPYATMTQSDVSECRTDLLSDDHAGRAEVQESIRDRIRAEIRSGVQTATQGAGAASSGATAATATGKDGNGTQH